MASVTSTLVNYHLLMIAAGSAAAAIGIRNSYPFFTFCGSVFILSGVTGIIAAKHFQRRQMQNILDRVSHPTPNEIQERERYIPLLRLDQMTKDYADFLYANKDQVVDQRAFDAFYEQFKARVTEIDIPTVSREFVVMHYSLERLLIKNYFKHIVEDLPYGIRTQIFDRALKGMIEEWSESTEMDPATIVEKISHASNLFSPDQIQAELKERKRLIKLV